ncbi:flavodoxin family protein [Candidatus Bipolaricaulota bacterium]
MKRVLIGVFSETGNTMKIGKAIRDEAAKLGFSVDLESVASIDATKLGDYGAAFIGSTCHSSDLAQPVLDLLAALPENSKLQVAGFVTHSTWGPSEDPRRQELFERWAGHCQPTFEKVCARRGIDVLGFFGCMGAPNPAIETFIRNTIITDEAEWAEYLDEVRQHPSDQDIQDARAFARGVLEKL